MASINEIVCKCVPYVIDIHVNSRANHQLFEKHNKNLAQQTTQNTINRNYKRCDIWNKALQENSFSMHLKSRNHFRNMAQAPQNSQILPHSELPTHEKPD